jgi:ankyrin repeat protein
MQAFNFSELLNVLNSHVSFDAMELDENDNTYLHHIVQQCDENTELTIRRLVGRHLIMDHQNIYGQTIYHLAARHAPPKIMQLLLELPGDFYSRDQEMDLDDVYGNSIAHYASVENIPIIAEYGFSLNRRNNDHRSPLLEAVHRNDIARACTLLEYGADTGSHDRNGNTALHYCVMHHIRRRPIIDAFMSTPRYRCNFRNKEGYSPLDFAIIRRSIELIKLLWETNDFKNCDLDRWIQSEQLSEEFKNFLMRLRKSSSLITHYA